MLQRKSASAGHSTDRGSSRAVQLVSENCGRRVYLARGQHFDVEDRYSVRSVVGSGAYGIVCSALDSTTLERVAIKRVNRVFEDLIDGRRIYREILILRLLWEHGCRNAMRLLRVLQPKEHRIDFRDLYFVTDYYDMDLYTVIKQGKEFNTSYLRNVAVQMLRCIADMHAMGIIHRDVKPSNVLLRGSPGKEEVVLCDFGLARAGMFDLKEPLDLTDYVVTRWYRSPELLFMAPYSFPVDVWSAGCVLAEYALRSPLFAGRDYVHQLQLVLSTIPVSNMDFLRGKSSPAVDYLKSMVKQYSNRRPLSSVLSLLPRDAFDLVSKMLTFEPSKRITAKGALVHPFLDALGDATYCENLSPPSVETSMDLRAELSESELRCAFWNEIRHYNTDKRNDTAVATSSPQSNML